MMFRVACRTVTRLTPAFFFPVNNTNTYDKDYLNKIAQNKPENGIERVKLMFKKKQTTSIKTLMPNLNFSEFDEPTVELNSVVQASLTGAFLGACYGGFVQSRVAYMDFIENNQATIFKNTHDAKKKLQDYVTVAFAKGAFRWGWRLGIFTGLFYLIATVIEVYKGYPSLMEFVLAGTITGALFKINLGLAATLVGAGLGAALSTVAGCAILGILTLTGFSMTDIRSALYKVTSARKEQMAEAMDKSASEKFDSVTIHHEVMVKEKGETTIDKL